MSYAAPVEVVQAALHRVGEAAIANLADGSVPAQIVASNYEGIVEDLLTRHAWTWATKTVDLTVIGETTAQPWGFAFAIPAEVINIRWLTCAGRKLGADEWELQSGQVLALRSDDLQAVATYRVTEGNWPGDFAECVVLRIKALFLEGLLDKWQEAKLVTDDLEGKPGRAGKIDRAIVRDKRQVPAKRLESTPLASAWRGGRRGFHRSRGCG